jgi:1-acyl-sn-glycerol-3-phosphate acyltransferase
MTFLRSLLYAALFYVYSAGLAIILLPALAFGVAPILWGFRMWCRGTLFLLRTVCGIQVEIRGREHVPAGAAVIAAKHQCMLDTMALWTTLPRASYVTKKELLIIPVYGWYVLRAGMIVVDREGHAMALRKLVRDAEDRLQRGRQIVIFPEGTRKAPGAPADYKPGIAALYRELGQPVIPLATNSGVHFPAHGFTRRPGVVVYEFLPPIPAGLKRAEFMRELRDRIETASSALLSL